MLLRMINKRARSSYKGIVTKESFDTWVEHWFATLNEIRQEMEKEGLSKTVEELNAIEIQQRSFVQSH